MAALLLYGSPMQIDPELKTYFESLDFAGQMAGEYLESINKTDLSALTSDEWRTFLDIIVKNQRDQLAELPPF